MKKILTITILVIACPAHAATIYKCTNAKGKPVFSQIPCSPSAEETTIHGPTMMGSVATDPADVDKMRDSARLRDIDRELAQKQRELNSLNDKMDRELAALRAKSQQANNNLAGATYQQGIATEMQSVTEKYSVKMDIARDKITRLNQEKASLSQTQ